MTCKREVNEAELTPSNQSKSPQILPIREEGHEDEAVEVETLDQDPVVVCGQEVHEQRHHHLAANLCTKFCKSKQHFKELGTEVARKAP